MTAPLHFLFPTDPLDPRQPDEMFAEQVEALERNGFGTSVCPLETLAGGRRTIRPRPTAGATIVYRGWMLSPRDYSALVGLIESRGGQPLVSAEAYLAAHYLPRWYPLIAELTPETRVFPEDADLESELRLIGWDRFFVKDYVKSLKTSAGSIIDDPSQIQALLAEMRKYRGEIEGGVCVRRVEDLDAESEVRYFVIHGRAHGPERGAAIPGIVTACAERIPSPFFSVDVARRVDGELRVVEIGDGQVSDLVGWTADRFAEFWD